MPSSKHDRIAETIARKLRAPYNSTKGADVVSPERTVEVEIDGAGLRRGMEQLQGYKQLRYLGVPNRLVRAAVEKTKGTKIGVMNEKGQIVKRAQRPARKRR
jgi:hypothetical protein